MNRTLCVMSLVPIAFAHHAARAQRHDARDDDHHDGPTHQPLGVEPGQPHRHAHPGIDLAHPLVGESPLPETHVKFRYLFADSGDGREHTFSAEVEYALIPQFSVEAVLPYTFLDLDGEPSRDRVNDAEISFKLASYRWVDANVLPAVGLGVGLPTGNEEAGIGSDHVIELEPFARVGAWLGRFEFIGGVSLGIPLNQTSEERDEDEDFEIAYNFSTLYHVAPSVQALLELHGTSVFAGDDDEHAHYLSPGLMTQPLRDKSITFGAGVSLPLTDERDFDYAVNVLVLVHF